MQLKIMIDGKEWSCERHNLIVPYGELSAYPVHACSVVFKLTRLIPLPRFACGDCCLGLRSQCLQCHRTELWLFPLDFHLWPHPESVTNAEYRFLACYAEWTTGT